MPPLFLPPHPLQPPLNTPLPRIRIPPTPRPSSPLASAGHRYPLSRRNAFYRAIPLLHLRGSAHFTPLPPISSISLSSPAHLKQLRHDTKAFRTANNMYLTVHDLLHILAVPESTHAHAHAATRYKARLRAWRKACDISRALHKSHRADTHTFDARFTQYHTANALLAYISHHTQTWQKRAASRNVPSWVSAIHMFETGIHTRAFGGLVVAASPFARVSRRELPFWEFGKPGFVLVSTQSPFEKRGKHGCVFEQREVDRVLGTSLWMYAQICMAMCGGEWVDVVVYAEGGGLVVHSVERDAAFGERVEVYVDRFVKRFVETLCPPGEEEMFEMGDVSYGGDGVFVDADEVERMLQGVRADMDMWYVNRGTHPFN